MKKEGVQRRKKEIKRKMRENEGNCPFEDICVYPVI